ncbi:hypothetical protein [Actinocrispum wychmicini]|uniref:Winged helix domain-containing protein n=1 Tax=Actinocrispum wychmicini TaxID=1213861 RepID=A0A4R2J4M1_9PSEU|nr:hypothetical protein [Actinocrispum wychmicini]TCO53144.1 hypothetical protein EV192_111341 [Actinocrispum wychmicini]
MIEARVRVAVDVRRDSHKDKPFGGLYLSAGEVDRLLASPATASHLDAVAVSGDGADVAVAGDGADCVDGESRLLGVIRTFGLSGLDVDLLLAALAPDVDVRFNQLYGYLHDDLTRRRVSVGLALELAGVSSRSA